MTSDKALGFAAASRRRKRERPGARAHCFKGDSSPRVPEIAPGTHNHEWRLRVPELFLLGGVGGRDSRAQTKRVIDLQMQYVGAELAPSAHYNSTASLQSLAGFVPPSPGGGSSLLVCP